MASVLFSASFFGKNLEKKHDWKYCSSFNNLRLFATGH